jgi:hypothetical protein
MGEGACARLGDHKDVFRWYQLRPALTEEFAQHSLHAIAYDGVANATAHGHAQARHGSRCRAPDHDQVGRVTPPSLTLQGQELTPAPDARLFGVGEAARHRDHPGCFGGMVTVSRRRLFARRRFRT